MTSKEISLMPEDLFFVDIGYKIDESFIFAISSPINTLKGLLELDNKEYAKLKSSAYFSKFNIEIKEKQEKISIKRKYGMPKILQEDFDSKRYILRKGFPDFPNCPYGNSFKMLGYDTYNNKYVRLSKSILKDTKLKIEEYKE